MIFFNFFKTFFKKKLDNNFFKKLEDKLIMSDVSITTTNKIINKLRNYSNIYNCKDHKKLYNQLKKEINVIFSKIEHKLIIKKTPFIILIIGVNGVGKTTTIGKLAYRYKIKGKKVLIAAGDTFRAAAIEQIKFFGKNIQIPVLSQNPGSDAASVIFDAIKSAKAKKIDIVIADTAGRMQNKIFLMEDLKKIVRVIKKIDINAPHEIMLVLDSINGQNNIKQVNLFNKTIGVTGITFTKLDSYNKNGIIISIADQFLIPIRYIGLGSNFTDLKKFNSNNFIKNFFI